MMCVNTQRVQSALHTQAISYRDLQPLPGSPACRGCAISTFEANVMFWCLQAFTPYTTHSAYLLLLRSILNAMNTFKDIGTKSAVNAKPFRKILDTQPDLPETNVLQTLINQKVSNKVEGSPAYFQTMKADLDPIVCYCERASHDYDECNSRSLHRGAPELIVLDTFMDSWHRTFSWEDAPLECNWVFNARFESVLDEYILNGPRILGPKGYVEDYTARYECQAPTFLSTSVHVIANRMLTRLPTLLSSSISWTHKCLHSRSCPRTLVCLPHEVCDKTRHVSNSKSVRWRHYIYSILDF
jgi:hypothetical protein